MAEASWELRGHCLEVCNCDYLCPCIPTNRTALPTHGHCTTVLTFQVERGAYGDLSLDDLSFAVVIRTPGPMADGDWSVGVIVDERATPPQGDALASIARGKAGGPMAPVDALTSRFLGIEARPIRFRNDGLRWSVSIADRVDQVADAVPSPVKPGEPMYLDNTGHRANPRIALAKSSHNHIRAFGLEWVDDGGANSGAYAPFHWAVS